MRTSHKVLLSLIGVSFFTVVASRLYSFAQGRYRAGQILNANHTNYTENPQIKNVLGAPVKHLAITRGWTTSSVFPTKEGIVIHLAGKISEGDLYLRAKKMGNSWTIISATLVVANGQSVEIQDISSISTAA